MLRTKIPPKTRVKTELMVTIDNTLLHATFNKDIYKLHAQEKHNKTLTAIGTVCSMIPYDGMKSIDMLIYCQITELNSFDTG